MNKQRREQVKTAIESLNEANELLEQVGNEERDAYDNMPEGLQYSERGCQLEENADKLVDYRDTLNDYTSEITDMVDELEQM